MPSYFPHCCTSLASSWRPHPRRVWSFITASQQLTRLQESIKRLQVPGAPIPTGTGGACGAVYSALSNSATPSVYNDVDNHLSAGDKTIPGAGGSLFAMPTVIICSVQISHETLTAFIVSATSPQAYPTGVSDMTSPRNKLFQGNRRGLPRCASQHHDRCQR